MRVVRNRNSSSDAPQLAERLTMTARANAWRGGPPNEI
jgi:hypothetical protein